MKWGAVDMGAPEMGLSDATDRVETAESVAGKPRRPKSGSYYDNGYVYFYNSGSEALFIVVSPRGGVDRIPVTNGSAAYNAIMAAIRNRKAIPISPNRVRELRAAAGGGRKAPKLTKASAREEIAEVAPPPPVAPPATSFFDSLPGWAPYAAGGVILSMIASALLLSSPRARLATLEK